jgi:4,5-dihydroxyphthalate decarboxylase
MKSETGSVSRRDFVRVATAAAAAASALSACGNSVAPTALKLSDAPSGETDGPPISIAGYRFPRVEALADGRVTVGGCSSAFREGKIGDLNTHVFSGPQTIDVTEIGLHPFMLAFANEGFRAYSLLPVFPIRAFRHKSIFVRTDRGIERPEDLRGKRIVTPGYSSTSLTWIRGILEDEYGVGPEDVEWVVSRQTSDAAWGTASKQENLFPDGLKIAWGPVGVDESDLLVSGEADAIFDAGEPRAFVEGHPIVARLFADSRQVERTYFARTGIFPIMHAVAVRNDLVDQHPWLPEAVFNAYSRAKRVNDEHLSTLGWAMISLPWFRQEFEETRDLMGDNYWPYGIEPNRSALETLFRYSYDQGLASRELTIEEVFHPATLGLSE